MVFFCEFSVKYGIHLVVVLVQFNFFLMDNKAVLDLLLDISAKLDSVLASLEELEDGIRLESEEEVAESPPRKKSKILSASPGQLIPFGSSRPVSLSKSSVFGLRSSQSDFGPNPSFGPTDPHVGDIKYGYPVLE